MDERLLKIGGEALCFDLDAIFDAIKLTETEVKIIVDEETEEEIEEISTSTSVDLTKYEFLKMMIEALLTSSDTDIDEKLGYNELEKLDIPFKLSYNTLLKYNIIKEA